MNDSIGTAAAQLRELGDSTIAEFDRRLAGIPVHLLHPFNQEAARLETELLVIYRVVALCARAEQDLAVIAASWGRIVEICDLFAARLSKLSAAHPECGAEPIHDRVLDLRNKCQRLQRMHQ